MSVTGRWHGPPSPGPLTAFTRCPSLQVFPLEQTYHFSPQDIYSFNQSQTQLASDLIAASYRCRYYLHCG